MDIEKWLKDSGMFDIVPAKRASLNSLEEYHAFFHDYCQRHGCNGCVIQKQDESLMCVHTLRISEITSGKYSIQYMDELLQEIADSGWEV